MRYQLTAISGKTRVKRVFEITRRNYRMFYDSKDPLKSSGVTKLKEAAKKRFPGKRFSFSLKAITRTDVMKRRK
jgi:hypothetical protein